MEIKRSNRKAGEEWNIREKERKKESCVSLSVNEKEKEREGGRGKKRSARRFFQLRVVKVVE